MPVGGVDRLALVEQIAVQDLLALCDALLLPEDDLQLAALLKSPLIGLSGGRAVRPRARARRLALGGALAARARRRTRRKAAPRSGSPALQARADLVTPHALLAEVLGEPSLGGPGQPATSGRARLLARLGPDAADPLDEVLNAALAYERAHPPSLQGFVHWLRRGGAQVKREAESGADAVRIMTVHGAKGLASAGRDPARPRRGQPEAGGALDGGGRRRAAALGAARAPGPPAARLHQGEGRGRPAPAGGGEPPALRGADPRGGPAAGLRLGRAGPGELARQGGRGLPALG